MPLTQTLTTRCWRRIAPSWILLFLIETIRTTIPVTSSTTRRWSRTACSLLERSERVSIPSTWLVFRNLQIVSFMAEFQAEESQYGYIERATALLHIDDLEKMEAQQTHSPFTLKRVSVWNTSSRVMTLETGREAAFPTNRSVFLLFSCDALDLLLLRRDPFPLHPLMQQPLKNPKMSKWRPSLLPCYVFPWSRE